MRNITKGQHVMPIRELNKIVKAYEIIGIFLGKFIDKKTLYKTEFIKGLDKSLKELTSKRTKTVKSFRNLIS